MLKLWTVGLMSSLRQTSKSALGYTQLPKGLVLWIKRQKDWTLGLYQLYCHSWQGSKGSEPGVEIVSVCILHSNCVKTTNTRGHPATQMKFEPTTYQTEMRRITSVCEPLCFMHGAILHALYTPSWCGAPRRGELHCVSIVSPKKVAYVASALKW